jgi:hypothetical protein
MTGYTKHVTDEELKETINRISENLDSTKELEKWVVYPDIPFDITIEQYKSIINMPENEKVLAEVSPENVEVLKKMVAESQPTLVEDSELKQVEAELDVLDKEEEAIPEEQKELTDEEKRELYIQQLKDSKKTFRPLRHPVKAEIKKTTISNPFGGSYHESKDEINKKVVTNEIINPYGTPYKKKRRVKNKEQQKSRKANR